ncbi:MAG TPA: sodium:solute symporter [Flavobacteriales bacterium]|nr:sodium:solute symporter [Flavobacteriales bacterium]
MTTNWFIPVIIGVYFAFLILISYLTSRKAGNDAFFVGERKSPWFIVAYGMIGASLSGVTFISIPGWVGATHFYYFQMVLGYLVGYYIIAHVLMPVYYRMNVISIYSYLKERFGLFSYKTGSLFFLLSRLIGASFRLYLVAIVLELIFRQMGFEIPFVVTVVVTVLLIWIYTNKGGIKTIIWTDTLQTTFMLIAVVLTLYSVNEHLNLSWSGMFEKVSQSEYSSWLNLGDFNDSSHFIKYFVSGVFIAIAMTGLDQDMMQKNLSCKNLKEAKKNMIVFSWVLVFVNILFLFLGAMLYMYANQIGMPIPEKTDYLFPEIALSGKLGTTVLVCFVLGLIASAYSSADSALTALTTSFSVDIMDLQEKYEPGSQERIRRYVHVGMSVAIVSLIILFRTINDDSVVSNLFKAAGYTYGPLLGLFTFGLVTSYKVIDKWVPVVAILSPILTYMVLKLLMRVMPEFEIGFEIILLNALITFIGLILLRSGHFKKQLN